MHPIKAKQKFKIYKSNKCLYRKELLNSVGCGNPPFHCAIRFYTDKTWVSFLAIFRTKWLMIELNEPFIVLQY